MPEIPLLRSQLTLDRDRQYAVLQPSNVTFISAGRQEVGFADQIHLSSCYENMRHATVQPKAMRLTSVTIHSLGTYCVMCATLDHTYHSDSGAASLTSPRPSALPLGTGRMNEIRMRCHG